MAAGLFQELCACACACAHVNHDGQGVGEASCPGAAGRHAHKGQHKGGQQHQQNDCLQQADHARMAAPVLHV
jgi:hypothetical protein